MIQFNEHLLVYSVIGHYLLIKMVAPKRALCFLSPAVSAMSNSLVWPTGFFFHLVFHCNFSWTSMPCLLPENVNKSKQHYYWDNNLCEGVVHGKIEKKVRIQSHSSYHKHLIESFETINSVKTGFHHLCSFSVPPVNLKMERKLLQ